MLQIGSLLRVRNAQEARQAFAEVRGLAGAIWNDTPSEPYEFPRDDVRTYLEAHADMSWDPDTGVIIIDKAPLSVRMEAGMIEPHLAHARKDMELAVSFNRNALFRNGYFYNGIVRKTVSHVDTHAASHWVHRHIVGIGMTCYSPADGQVMSIPSHGCQPHGLGVRTEYLQQMLQDGQITATKMNPHDVLLFNNRLLHEAGIGSRFRSLITGTMPR